MPTVKPRTMSGVLELLPLEQAAFQGMVDTIRTEFERFGFLPISTPTMELVDVLLTKTGGETERQIYFVQPTGALGQEQDPDVALRFDLTVPLARYVAEHQQHLAFPFRRYQIQPVFRGEKPQRGRYREFLQCDIDVVGRDLLSINHDAEIPAVIASLLEKLQVGPFTIRISNRKVLRGVLHHLGVHDPEQQTQALREIDKLERLGFVGVSEALARLNMQPGKLQRLLELVGKGPVKGVEIDRVLGLLEQYPRASEGVSDLRRVFSMMGVQGVSERRYSLDLSIARGLDYYTGTVYETSLDEYPELGSVCSGGRYDDLASQYTSKKFPGVGISIGLTRLFGHLQDLRISIAGSSPVAVLVLLFDEDDLANNFSIATQLRQAGINTEVFLEKSRFGHQMTYAERSGIRLVLICGEHEQSRGVIKIRNVITKAEVEIPSGRLVDAVKRRLSAKRVKRAPASNAT